MHDHDSLVCVGLDPEPENFRPRYVNRRVRFSSSIARSSMRRPISSAPINHRSHITLRWPAEDQLADTIAYIRERAPSVPVILDSKRGDIGSTAEKYAHEAFGRYGADAVTINPYLGFDSAEPFLKYADKGIVVLCRTSNQGAREFQDLEVDGRKLDQIVAEHVAQSGMRTVTACSWSVRPIRPSSPHIRARTGEMTFWCRVSVRRAAT
jgi:orotidine-5'-phosphate decarboxylase